MALNDYQYQYTNPEGVSVTVGDGTVYGVIEVDGLEGFTARVGDIDLPRGHGSVPGLHLEAARQALLAVEFHGDATAVIDERWATLAAAFAVSTETQGTLKFKQPGRVERMIRCRPVTLARRLDERQTIVGRTNAVLLAADPRIYSSVEKQENVPLYTPSGGTLDYPIGDYPKEWPAGTTVELSVTNDGAVDAHPTVRFYGPATEVTLTNTTNGDTLTVQTSIAAGQVLTYDGTAWVTASGALVVSLDGAGRYGSWVERTPFKLPPGVSLLRFESDNTDAQAVISWRDTWLS